MPDAIETPDVKAVILAVDKLKIELDKKSIDKDKVDRIEAFLDEQEKKNQKIVEKYKQDEQNEKDMKERVDSLEVELARASSQSVKKNYRETAEYKALTKFCTKGEKNLSVEEKAALRTDSNELGGFLTMTEQESFITKKKVEVSNIRSLARVRSITSKSIDMTVRQTIPTAFYEGELETAEKSNSTYSNETIVPFRQTVQLEISRDLLQDSAFSMDSEIISDGTLAFAVGEGNGFVTGTGFKQPQGFLTDQRVIDNARPSTLSASFNFDDIMNLTGDLKEGYDPIYIFNRRTLAFIRTLKGGDGHPLWQPGMNGIVMNTINGVPYLIAEAMPDIGSATTPIAFADLRGGYTITDRTGMVIIRDELTQASIAQVIFTLMRWNTGKVTLPEAIKILKLAA